MDVYILRLRALASAFKVCPRDPGIQIMENQMDKKIEKEMETSV